MARHPIAHLPVLRTLLVLLSACVEKASGLHTFRPNCTTPPERVNFVLQGNIRGTLDIVWSCLFTLLICTWTVQHLNITEQHTRKRDASAKKSTYRRCGAWVVKKWRKLVPKLKWMVLTVMLPEFLLGKALQDKIMAKPCKDMKRLASQDEVEWTTTHGFYANMGGFVLRVKKRDGPTEPYEDTEIYLNAKGMLRARCGQNAVPQILRKLPLITKDEIEERSKGDFFVKATALLQVLWLIIQVIVRAARGLIISQLEFAVLAYAACSIITYILCWSKPQDTQIRRFIEPDEMAIKLPERPRSWPQDAQTPRFIEPDEMAIKLPERPRSWPQDAQTPRFIEPDEMAISDKLPNECYRLFIRYQPRSWFATSLRLMRLQNLRPVDMTKTDIFKPPPNDARYDYPESKLLPGTFLTLMDDGFIIAGLIFGTLHGAAWNSPFPTPVERLLWRIASVLSAAVFPLYYLMLLCDIHADKSGIKQALRLVESIIVLSYVVARLYLFVEMFRSLCFLPPEAFLSTWSSYIPHVA